MAFARFLVIFLIVVAVISTTTLAVKHIIGDTAKWRIGFDYKTWAEEQMFMVGDTLVFEYTPGDHNVHNVTGADFKTCTVSLNSVGWTSGNDIIELKTAGTEWYICGKPGHCTDGQKIAINVMEASSPAPTPTSSNGFKSMTTTSVSNLFLVIMAAIATFFMISFPNFNNHLAWLTS